MLRKEDCACVLSMCAFVNMFRPEKFNNAVCNQFHVYMRDAIFSFFSKVSSTFHTLSFHACVFVQYTCVCSFLRSYGEKFIVSIDRTRKNRRGKISSLFLFAADLLISDSSAVLSTTEHTIYI